MIVVRVQGGLGNQMFQYAFGRCLAERHGVGVAYDTSSFDDDPLRNYALDAWRVDPRLLGEDEKKLLPKRYGGAGWKNLPRGRTPLRHVREKPYGFHRRYVAASDHAYLDGYWQSEQFFPGLRDELLCAFQPSRKLSPESAACERKMLATRNSVAVHVRRTDYLQLPFMQVCGLDYYRRCLNLLTARSSGVEAFVFSDDADWCRTNLRLPCPTHFVDHNDGASAHEDLWLMSRCRHHIIPNSSFSWWAAWLKEDRGGEVFAPTPWFADPKLGGQDIVPDRWTKVTGEVPASKAA